MREIKFRAWLEDEMLSQEDLIDKDQTAYAMYTILTDPEQEDGVAFMQYTGLKDKNGREIYEGDIIQFTNNIDEVYEEVGKVVWEQDECNFVAQYKTTNPITHKEYGTTNTIYLISNKTYKNDVEYEVIGNIYENPELLEVQP